VIELRLRDPLDTVASLQGLDGVRAVESIGHEVRLFTTSAELTLPRVYHALAAEGHGVIQTRVSPVTLDDVFLELTGKELRD
jgi:D-lyxose ketol-isomerase